MICCVAVGDVGMPIMKDPFFKRYISGSSLDHVEPLFRQLKNDRPDLQLLMVILPGKTPVYGEWWGLSEDINLGETSLSRSKGTCTAHVV